jgi:hypothetical protein
MEVEGPCIHKCGMVENTSKGEFMVLYGYMNETHLFSFCFQWGFYLYGKLYTPYRMSRLKQDYIQNTNAMIAGIDTLQAQLASSPSYQGRVDLQTQYFTDLKYVSDDKTVTFLLWSAGIALGGLILFQLSGRTPA